ncbi:MAG: dihydroorotase [Gammaproteobacteria bacterium]|nr:dihydroorotase [Gammaproteobacteria bacterium]
MIRLIKNGRVIDPANNEDSHRDIWIDEDGRISNGSHDSNQLSPEQIIDASDCWVIPGLVDLAARFREPGEEQKGSICSESAAALASGITTVCLPPDTIPVIDTPAVVELIQQRTKRCNSPHIYALGAMSVGLDSVQLSELGALKEAGCVGISNANHPISDSQFMRNIMDYAVSYNLKVFLTPVDQYLSKHGCAHEGQVATRMGLPGIPVAAETAIVARDLALIEATGVSAHFCRLSSARSVEMIANAQQRGLQISADVSAHQLFLTENDIVNFNSNAHVLPPLRTERDRDALRQAVADGIISAICSDHQPHEADAKLAPFAETEAGMSTLETLLPLCMKFIHEQGMDPATILRSVTQGPADILGIQSGNLATGKAADITILDPQTEWTLDSSNMLSHGKNTAFGGWPFKGIVKNTLINGEQKYSCL